MADTQIVTATIIFSTTLTEIISTSLLGLIELGIDWTNLPAGTVVMVSVNAILISGGNYVEIDNFSFSNPIAVPVGTTTAAPTPGYVGAPANPPRVYNMTVGPLMVNAQIISGSANTTACDVWLNQVS